MSKVSQCTRGDVPFSALLSAVSPNPGIVPVFAPHSCPMSNIDEGLLDVLRRNAVCHLRCYRVNQGLRMLQMLQEHLTKYESVPELETHDPFLKPFNFQLKPKKETPLCRYGTNSVSVSVPLDTVNMSGEANTLEIMLFDKDGKGNGTKHPMCLSDIRRFSSVGELAVFLDELVICEVLNDSA